VDRQNSYHITAILAGGGEQALEAFPRLSLEAHLYLIPLMGGSRCGTSHGCINNAFEHQLTHYRMNMAGAEF